MKGLLALQRFARDPRAAGERCDLCAREVGEEHDHLLEGGGVKCACRACALLFAGKRVPPKIERARPVALPDVPVSLAWIVRLADGSTVVRYPSPAGIAQAQTPGPADVELAPEIEAHLQRGDEAYRVSIDHCYALAGVLRARGDLDAWFARLAARA